MSEVVSFANYTPAPRFDSTPWTDVQIEEATASSGPWTVIDTIALTPTDADPSAPAARSFTITNGTAPDLWYRITFVDGGGNLSLPSAPVQNLTLTHPAYATVDELFRVLKVRTPSGAQTVAAQRDLDTATLEIDTELDRVDDTVPFTDSQLALIGDVCLDRAADLWRHRESAAGMLGIPDETVASPQPMRYAWTRYAQRLSPLKEQFGLA